MSILGQSLIHVSESCKAIQNKFKLKCTKAISILEAFRAISNDANFVSSDIDFKT